MWIVVGSSALNQERFNIKFRKSKDVDIWTTEKECYNLFKSKGKPFDVKVLPREIYNLVETDGIYATPNSIYTIKCSHLGWNNPVWNKHKSDIINLKNQGCVLIPELYSKLTEFWKTELGDKSFLSLRQDKKNFFNDNVTYVYDHDWLHEQVAYPNKPIYTKCLMENEDVLIDKSKFDKLTFSEQVRMFREEITVIAIERWLVNPKTKGKYSWVQAYNLSLKKTITQLTKSWATDFIVQNLEEFIKPDYSYFKHTLNLIKEEI
ncbi:hypothetical protein vBVpaMR16F_246 [Vibrio phage vB_VpaM_R16F]|nr:hypothetical protein vBVpaMR16F_246 [Vibrio phage vB_VpaM_R16F]